MKFPQALRPVWKAGVEADRGDAPGDRRQGLPRAHRAHDAPELQQAEGFPPQDRRRRRCPG